MVEPPSSFTFIHCPLKWTVSGEADSLGVMSATALNQTTLPAVMAPLPKSASVAQTSGLMSASVQVEVVLRSGVPELSWFALG
jgi:hypothetical protein